MKKGIDLRTDGTQIKCSECGNETFSEVLYLFKVSRFVTLETKDSLVPMPTFACSKCGNINKEFSINPLDTAENVPE